MPIEDIYEELYEVLSNMDKTTVMRIPEEILNRIISQRNKNFKSSIDSDDLFNENNISKDAMDLLCWIDYNYWASPERKKAVDDIKQREILSKNEDFDRNRIFDNNYINSSNEEAITNSQELVIRKENPILAFIRRIMGGKKWENNLKK